MRLSSYRRLYLLSFTALLLFAPSASGATITYGPVSFGPASTNWSSGIVLPKWDPTLFPGQMLTGISFDLQGEVEGDARFESLDGAPATVTMNLQATVTLIDPSLNVLAAVIPVANTSDNVTAFDGTIDFGGTSGKSYLGLTGSDSDTGNSVDFPTFTGAGNILLPITGSGTSNGSGAGNLVLQFLTSASASASVTYTYQAIPEPTGFVIAGMALIGLVGARLVGRRRA